VLYIQFLIGFVLYTALSFASYHSGFKTTKYYYLLVTILAIFCNLIWFQIAKQEPSSSVLMIKGLFWDVMLMMCYLIVPILFFSARFSVFQGVGLILVLSGLLLTKVG
jgi:multidrug transporter EmrE-like cation transporter